jgi:hypothetical protein
LTIRSDVNENGLDDMMIRAVHSDGLIHLIGRAGRLTGVDPRRILEQYRWTCERPMPAPDHSRLPQLRRSG